jgi:hypothetical protein
LRVQGRVQQEQPVPLQALPVQRVQPVPLQALPVQRELRLSELPA